MVTLTAGDRWRTEITSNLQERAIKMLLVCKDDTLAAPGVLEEIVADQRRASHRIR